MKLSLKAIDRPRVTLVGTILVLALAVLAAFNIPVQRTPAITKAVVLIAIPYPGASPVEVEEQITRKVEDALQKLNNVDFIASSSMRGASVTQVMFLDGVEPKRGRDDVKHLVDEIRSELPVGREVQPQINDIDFEDAPIILVSLTPPAGFDRRRLKQIAEEAEEELKTVPGVANTQLFGGRERELHVNVHPDLMAEYNITLADIKQALTAFHSELPGGSLDSGVLDPQVRSETRFRGVDDIREAVLARRGEQVIHISDIAEVLDTYRRPKSLAMIDGQEAATIIVNKEADINTLAAAQAVKARVEQLRDQYPHIKFTTTRDTSEEIALMFRVLGSSFMFGALLVLVILAWAMDLKTALIVLMAIPMSCAVALIFLYFFNIPISNMVIFAYILVLGMVVDGAIIVAENIHRHIERGEDPITASKLGIEEVSLPVIAADLTTISAYLPMLLVPGIMGDFMGVMPKVVTVALIGSILVDHFLIPVVASRWYSRKDVQAKLAKTRKTQARHGGATVVESDHLRPNIGFLARSYGSFLRAALHARWAVVVAVIVALVGAFFLLKQIGLKFFPGSDRGQLVISYELPLGYSIEETLAAQDAIVAPLRDLQKSGEVLHYVTSIGSSEGLASRLEGDSASGPEFGTVMVQLTSPLDRTRHINDVEKQIRAKMKPWPGIKILIEQPQDGPPGGADVAVRLTGDNVEQLGGFAEQITASLAQIPNVTDARTDYRPDSPEIVVEPNAAVVGLYGMTEAQVAQSVATAILGDTTIELPLEKEDVTVRLQVAPEFQRSKEDVERLMIVSPSGQRAPIGTLTEIHRDMGLFSVNRRDRSRAVLAKCNVMNGLKPDDVFKQLRAEILPELGFRPVPPPQPVGVMAIVQNTRNWVLSLLGKDPQEAHAIAFLGAPGTEADGVRAIFTGENEERDKNFAYLLNAMAIAVILIFAILVLQFNSFRQTMIVLSAVPLSFIGVIVGHWVMGFPFSLASFIGLVSLTGIVVNDSIVLVDFANRARRRGMAINDAIVEAGVNRLRPVLLTTVTTIGGLLPLLGNWSGGAEFWQPLCAAVVYGLAMATLLTLVVVPVLYSLAYSSLIERSERRILNLFFYSAESDNPQSSEPLPAATPPTAAASTGPIILIDDRGGEPLIDGNGNGQHGENGEKKPAGGKTDKTSADE